MIKLMLYNLKIKINHRLRLNMPDYVANLVNHHINSIYFRVFKSFYGKS